MHPGFQVTEYFRHAPTPIGQPPVYGVPGPPRCTAFEAEKAGHHRMVPFENGRTFIPHKGFEDIPVHAWRGALQNIAHVFEIVKSLPRLLISIEPLLA